MISSRLRKILEGEVAIVPGQAGAAARADVKGVLKNAQGASLKVFYTAAVMTLLLFLLMIFELARNLDSPTAFAAISAASGVGLTGLVYLMLKIARDITQSSLLLDMAARLSPQDMKDVFLAVLGGIKTLKSNGTAMGNGVKSDEKSP